METFSIPSSLPGNSVIWIYFYQLHLVNHFPPSYKTIGSRYHRKVCKDICYRIPQGSSFLKCKIGFVFKKSLED